MSTKTECKRGDYVIGPDGFIWCLGHRLKAAECGYLEGVPLPLVDFVPGQERHGLASGDIVVAPNGYTYILGKQTGGPALISSGHDQAITDEDARRVGIDPEVPAIETIAGLARHYGAPPPRIEPDTTERVEVTSITINLAKGMATDVALMHVISRAAVMLGAGPRDWDAMAAWLRERELPK